MSNRSEVFNGFVQSLQKSFVIIIRPGRILLNSLSITIQRSYCLRQCVILVMTSLNEQQIKKEINVWSIHFPFFLSCFFLLFPPSYISYLLLSLFPLSPRLSVSYVFIFTFRSCSVVGALKRMLQGSCELLPAHLWVSPHETIVQV